MIGIRIDQDILEALEIFKQSKRLSTSKAVNLILEEFFKQQNYPLLYWNREE